MAYYIDCTINTMALLRQELMMNVNTLVNPLNDQTEFRVYCDMRGIIDEVPTQSVVSFMLHYECNAVGEIRLQTGYAEIEPMRPHMEVFLDLEDYPNIEDILNMDFVPNIEYFPNGWPALERQVAIMEEDFPIRRPALERQNAIQTVDFGSIPELIDIIRMRNPIDIYGAAIANTVMTDNALQLMVDKGIEDVVNNEFAEITAQLNDLYMEADLERQPLLK
jgi:hypothetical protein